MKIRDSELIEGCEDREKIIEKEHKSLRKDGG
jgi:hypothetical protein